MGRGVGGAPLSIGIEHKTISDLVSSLKTNRIQGHQLPGMLAAEEGESPLYDLAWLCVEGEWLYDTRGMLQRRIGKSKFRPLGMTIDEVFKRLTVMHLCGGLNWVSCASRHDTVKWISSLYHALTDKDLDEHKSHLGIYRAPTLVPLSQFQDTISTLPHVGGRVSKAAERQFGSIKRAVNASAKEWAAIETVTKKGQKRKFGILHAQKLVEVVNHG
jgi:ERCC4-type nuclease